MIDVRLTVHQQGRDAYVWRLTVNGALVQIVTRARRRHLALPRRN